MDCRTKLDFVPLEVDMFHRRFRRKRRFFPFWIFIILFFVVMGKSSSWMWMLPFFLIWVFGPMLWAISSGGNKWDHNSEWESPRDPIPPQWQTPPQNPDRSTVFQTAPPLATPDLPSRPTRSTAGLPTTCPACGGPINNTTLDWRADAPHCGYCGTNLK